MTEEMALQSMSATTGSLNPVNEMAEVLGASPHGRGIAEILEVRRTKLDRLLGGSEVAREQQPDTLPQAESAAGANGAGLLRIKIEEIRALADKLESNASPEHTRDVLYCIYTRAAAAIGRNSVEAIRADAIHRISTLASVGILSGHIPRRENPEEYIEKKIIPHLDEDMRAHAFDMNLYRAGMRSFYQVLGSWRSRGRSKKVFAGR